MTYLDKLIDEFVVRTNLSKREEDHIVIDDTQVGIEFAFEQMTKELEDKDKRIEILEDCLSRAMQQVDSSVEKLEGEKK